MIKLYDSALREKVEFVPLDPEGKRVGLYFCGPTVYDSVHLGHARAAVVPDLIRRYLEHRGYEVRWVANFTDIDDRIILRAIREKRSWRDVISVYMAEYGRVTAALGNRPPDVRPRATDHIPEMIDLVERLLSAGNAYVAKNGDVYFDTSSFDGYLELSGRKLEDQETGRSGRLSAEEVANKRQPTDFILWKLLSNDSDEMRANPEAVPGWDSPWGKGRPGWHLECSAISQKYLGMPFDIHGGGRDLLFPHHENERAQNDCAYCQELGGGTSVKYWVHNAFVTVVAETDAEKADEHTEDGAAKMSKSLGNVKWIEDMIWPHGPYDPMAVRMLMLQSHYRSPLAHSPTLLDRAAARQERIYSMVERLVEGQTASAAELAQREPSPAVAEATKKAVLAFEAGMDDDFNTPRALAAIDELIKVGKGLLNASKGEEGSSDGEVLEIDRWSVATTIDRLCHLLGLSTRRPRVGGATAASAGEDSEGALLQVLGELRQEARDAKDWALSDRIRDRLAELGHEIRDLQGGGFEISPKG